MFSNPPMPLIPLPDWVLQPNYELWVTVIFGALALMTLFKAIYDARKTQSWFPIALFIGAGLAVIYEPINDVLGHCFYSEHGMNYVWLTSMGRRIPVYIGFCFFFYFYTRIWLCMDMLAKGVSAMQWMRTYLVTVFVAQLFEYIPISMSIWGYYGDNQPLQFGSFPPLWWGFINGSCLISIAAAMHLLRTYVLRGPARTWIGLSVPIFTMMFHGGPAIPVTFTLNATMDVTATTIASLITIGLGIAMVHWSHAFSERLRLGGFHKTNVEVASSQGVGSRVATSA